MNDDRHIKIESDRDGETHSLTIRGINRDDMGKYTCELDNRNGKAEDSTTMYVHCVPVVKQKLKDIVSKEGQLNIVFDVTIEAWPEPEIKWCVVLIISGNSPFLKPCILGFVSRVSFRDYP